MSTYFRVIPEYKGDQLEFIPKSSYEQVELRNGFLSLHEFGNNNIKEVCFSKTIPGCLFAINMFLKEGKYYIYHTQEVPCIDLSDASIGDFSAIEEVRYRRNVACEFYGKIDVSDFLVYSLRETYEDCKWGETFDHEKAKIELKRYDVLNERVVMARNLQTAK